jgi:hypothetical protein
MFLKLARRNALNPSCGMDRNKLQSALGRPCSRARRYSRGRGHVKDITYRRVFCDRPHGNPATGSILVQASAQEGPMRTEVDLTKLTPYQREVLTAFVRPLSKNEVVQLLQIVEATIPSAGVA